MRLNAILYQAAAIVYVASPATARFMEKRKAPPHLDAVQAAAQADACGPPGSVQTEYVTVTSTVYVNGPVPTPSPDSGRPGGSPPPTVITVVSCPLPFRLLLIFC